MNRRIVVAGLAAALLSGGALRAETPAEAVDRIGAAWVAASRTGHNNAYVSVCREVSHEQGTAIIAPIMARSKDWKSEEVLMFATAVVLLPPDKAIPLLDGYKKKGTPSEKTCAYDLLAEIEEYKNNPRELDDL